MTDRNQNRTASATSVRSAHVRAVAATSIAVSGLLLLVGCSAAPTIDGVWSTSLGGTATVNENGACTGMYFDNGRVLDIGGPETCTLGSKSDDGTYTLVVQQPPNQATYHVRFDGDTMSFESGGTSIELKRQ
jgi:hypothetical protein